jgi:tetratricopeptide (TPR) repeat protein
VHAHPPTRTHAALRTPAESQALCSALPAAATAADRELRTRAEKTPRDARGWVALGNAWVRAARRGANPALYTNAEACAEVATAKSPDDPAALQLLALAYQDDHRFAEVRAIAQRLVARDADDPFAFGLLSDAELELGNRDAAIEAAQRMVDLKPGLAAYGRAAHLRYLQGDVAGAKRLYQLAIAAGDRSRDPEPRAWMIVQAALLFLAEKDYAGAEAGFGLALREIPGYAPALRGKQQLAAARASRPAQSAEREEAARARAAL